MPRTIPRPVTLLLLAASVAAVGCSGGGGRVAAGGTVPPEVTSTTTALPSTTAPPPAPSTTATTRRGPTTSTTRRPTTTSPTALRPPSVVVPRQGDRVVAVFVATGTSLSDSSFAKARARLEALGYSGRTGGDTACSKGAKEALPQLEEHSMSLEFATQADAARFAALYGTVLGTAAVTVFCAD